MIRSIKLKLIAGFCAVHLGLALAAAALLTDSYGQLGGTPLRLLLAAVGVMYAAYLYSLLAVGLPVRRMVIRYQQARAWRTWILTEVPTILALAPLLIAALRLLKDAWEEMRSRQAAGELGIQSLGAIARKFAAEAEELSRDPAIEAARKRLQDSL